MRKVIGILLYIVAGFFVYMVCLLAFVNQTPPIAKWGIVAGFSIPAALFLFGGLAVTRFQNWRRDSGIVILAGAGFTSFLVFTLACLLMTDEFKRMMEPDSLQFFSAYIAGSCFILGTVALGVVLLRAGKRRAEQAPASDVLKAALEE